MSVEIIAKNVSLDFQLRKPGLFDMLKENRSEKRDALFRAVNDVSFTLNAGDRVGVIGTNGAGKSTLLKLIAGVLNPTQGQILLSGDVFPLLDLSMNLIQSATCMQNIRLSGMLKGLKGAALKEYINAVRLDADIEPFIYSPISTLSAGMKTRLLVSLIGDVNPEILVIDEWIGTADVRYTNHKEGRFNRLVESSDILVLATHNRNIVRKFCNKVLLIDKGKLIFFGDVADGYKSFNKLIGMGPSGGQ